MNRHWNMPPVHTTDNESNRWASNAVVGCDGCVRVLSSRIPSADSDDVLLRQAAGSHLLSAKLTTLRHLVRRVLGASANKQMRRQVTRWNVASMKDTLAFRDGTNEEFVAHSMDSLRLTINPDRAVPVLVSPPRPQPMTLTKHLPAKKLLFYREWLTRRTRGFQPMRPMAPAQPSCEPTFSTPTHPAKLALNHEQRIPNPLGDRYSAGVLNA